MVHRSLLRVMLGTSAFTLLTTCASLVCAQATQPVAPAPQPGAQPPPPALGSQPPPPPGVQPGAPAAAPPGPPAAAPPAYGYPPPPPGYGYGYPPPPGYGYGYPPPPGYYPMQGKPPPATLSYEGGPVPPGYHLEERPRRGLMIAGPIVLGVPWAIGLLIASATNYDNSSGWLIVPALGPWITLAARHDSRCGTNSVGCTVDRDANASARTVLVLDGLMQGAGAAMLIIGIASPKQLLVRDMARLTLKPARFGSNGYGALVSGQF